MMSTVISPPADTMRQAKGMYSRITGRDYGRGKFTGAGAQIAKINGQFYVVKAF